MSVNDFLYLKMQGAEEVERRGAVKGPPGCLTPITNEDAAQGLIDNAPV